MAERAISQAKIFYHGFDLSGSSNQVSIQYSAEMLDNTVMSDSARSKLAGLKDFTIQVQGFSDMATTGNDQYLFSRLGTASQNLTICPTTGAAGEVAYSAYGVVGNYTPFASGAVGEILPFDLQFYSEGAPIVRGMVEFNSTAVSASSASTGHQLGALSSSQTMHSFLHCYAATGTSLDVVIQSDDNASFTSATNQITHAQLTGVGSEHLTKAGVVADTYWRASFTIVAGGGAFSFAVVLGIV